MKKKTFIIINKLLGQLTNISSRKYMYSLEDVESTRGLTPIFTRNILIECFFYIVVNFEP